MSCADSHRITQLETLYAHSPFGKSATTWRTIPNKGKGGADMRVNIRPLYAQYTPTHMRVGQAGKLIRTVACEGDGGGGEGGEGGIAQQNR